MKHWKERVAILGVLISFSCFAFRWLIPTLVHYSGTAVREHSFFERVVALGYEGEIIEGHWIREFWSWKVPQTLNLGNSDHLFLQCERRSYWYTTYGISERVELDSFRSDLIEDPVSVTVQGDFKWEGGQTQTTPANSGNPLQWSWVFEPTSLGDKMIQVELPNEWRADRIKVERIFQAPDSLSKRFIWIPLKVTSFGISSDVKSVLSILQWIVVLVFGAPWLGKLAVNLWDRWKERRKRKRQRRIILPSEFDDPAD